MIACKDLTSEPVTLPRRALTSAELLQLVDPPTESEPPETEWFGNINNAQTRRAHRYDLKEFMAGAGIRMPIELRLISRARVLAWRMDWDRHKLVAESVRRKLSALSSFL